MRVPKFLILLILIYQSVRLYSQESLTISGYIYDKKNGEVLIGATIYEPKSKTGTISNEYGFYSFTLPKMNTQNNSDSTFVYISYLGYKTLKYGIKGTNRTDFYLEQGIELGEVIKKETKKDNIVKRNEIGTIKIPIKEIKALPSLFGEVDIMKAYGLTVGIQTGGEGKSNMFVRGGSSDQNLILLDDVPLYYVAHFAGFFSIFNADAINSTSLIKSGFPARYGSKLSSVLDIRMREGNMKSYHVNGTIGLLSSRLSVEGPIIKNKASFIVSVRKNILPIFRITQTGFAYKFYDFNIKLNYKLSQKDNLFFSTYMGDDIVLSDKYFDIANILDKNKKTKKIKWGNKLFAFRWNHIYNNKLFSNLTISNTHYRYTDIYNKHQETDTSYQNIKNKFTTAINDIGLKLSYIYLINPKYKIRFGMNSILHTFMPNNSIYEQTGSDIESLNINYVKNKTAFEQALYIENDIKLNRIGANIGIRYSHYIIDNQHYALPEPRLLFNYVITTKFSIKYAYSLMNQYVHLLSSSGAGYPFDYWMPTTKNIKPEQSQQHSLGLTTLLLNNNIELQFETYYKNMNNLIAFKPGQTLIGHFDNWEQIVEKEGTGTNYGVELFLQKLNGKTTGWIGITLAKAERQFLSINNGNAYPFKYDRLFNFNVVLNHTFFDKLTISTTWTYVSSYPLTIATEYYKINGEMILKYGDKNSVRIEPYHRLDFSVSLKRKLEKFERAWSFSIFNLYNRKNPYYYFYQKNNNQSIGLYKLSLFGFMPTISYNFKF